MRLYSRHSHLWCPLAGSPIRAPECRWASPSRRPESSFSDGSALTDGLRSTARNRAVKAAVWENQIGGLTRHNVTFSRIYRDGDQWKATHSFGFNNLLTLAKLADQAHTLIAERSTQAADAADDHETA